MCVAFVNMGKKFALILYVLGVIFFIVIDFVVVYSYKISTSMFKNKP